MLFKIVNFLVMHAAYFYHRLRVGNLKKHLRQVGEHVIINPGFDIGYPQNLILKSYVSLEKNVFINAAGGVTIDSGCVLGPMVTIFSVNHIVEGSETLPFSNDNQCRPVYIGPNCWIGARAFILPGVTVGEGSIVAGGAVVCKDVPPCSVVGGNPARVLKTLDQEAYARRKAAGRYCDWLQRQ